MQRRTSRSVLGLSAGTLALLLAACSSSSGTTPSGGGTAPAGGGGAGGGDYVIGISNTLVGNGWREEMICASKAQSLASGKVKKFISANRNGGPTEQIADLRSMISQGVNAIIVNPSDPDKLNSVISEAKAKGIVVVAVDSAVTSPDAYNVTNDQVEYGRLGGKALADLLGGKGNVVEMRGIPGVPADTDRHTGFTTALKDYPDIKVVQEVNTGWDFSKGGQQALDLLNSATKVDGIWTSGIDYTVVNAFKTLNKPPVPVIGADENGFIGQLLNDPTVKGAAVTNPAVIGGVGTAIAIDVLSGKAMDKKTVLKPEVWLKTDTEKLKANYVADRAPTFSAATQVKPFTTYSNEQLAACKGPGE
ncbi:ABC transporter substrate-binding protein [Lapillicoccus sp.]|uniref:ABC transporter substrate-binding protein n=1 Tax=Lapillicoccus sp. TaxID=1909287 RepID=UPI00326676DF